MRKKVGIIKRVACISLVFLLSINSFAAIVSDNDGAAFITKAEFDALKNNFQSQIDSYNQSIDSKIDGAIASYLAGIKLATEVEDIVTYNQYNWLYAENENPLEWWSATDKVAHSATVEFWDVMPTAYLHQGEHDKGYQMYLLPVKIDGVTRDWQHHRMWIKDSTGFYYFTNRHNLLVATYFLGYDGGGENCGSDYHGWASEGEKFIGGPTFAGERNNAAKVFYANNCVDYGMWSLNYQSSDNKIGTTKNIIIAPISNEDDYFDTEVDTLYTPIHTHPEGTVSGTKDNTNSQTRSVGERSVSLGIAMKVTGNYSTTKADWPRNYRHKKITDEANNNLHGNWGLGVCGTEIDISANKVKPKDIKIKEICSKVPTAGSISEGIPICVSNTNKGELSVSFSVDKTGWVMMWKGTKDGKWGPDGRASTTYTDTTYQKAINKVTAGTNYVRKFPDVDKGDIVWVVYLPETTSSGGKLIIDKITKKVEN